VRPLPDTSPHIEPARYLTEDIPPIGGAIKQREEDFFVEEIPLYQPSGEGEHIYLMLEKRGMPSLELVGLVARHFGVRRGDVGYAGLKDKHAVTRQVLSVYAPGRAPESFPSLQHDRVSVLWVDRHTNKLRRGHLAGNRFSIRIRDVQPEAVITARRVLSVLAQRGVPDRVGEQRFGALRNNHLVGRALFIGDFGAAVDQLLGPPRLPGAVTANVEARAHFQQGEYNRARELFPKSLRTERTVLGALARGAAAEAAIREVDPSVLGYYLSAFQSAVFNAALDDRIAAGTLETLLPGDIAVTHGRRNYFKVDDAVLNDPETAGRLERVELSPSGPMWGPDFQRATGEPGEQETGALRRFGLEPADLAGAPQLASEMTSGDRRPYRVPVRNIDVEGGVDEHGAYVRCAFDLPRGAFATTVMAEIMKPDRIEQAPEDQATTPPAGRDERPL